MTHTEFWEMINKLSECKSRDLYYDWLSGTCFTYITSLEAENADLKTRLSGKTNHCEACDGMGQEIARLKNSIREQNKIIMPIYTMSCKDCPPPYRDSDIIPDCPEHEPTCIECWLEWMAEQ